MEQAGPHRPPDHQPQRIDLEVPAGRRAVVAHPILVEAALGLEPLAGEVGGGERSGGGVDAAEGGVGAGPDFHSSGVRREDRAADLVGADE